MKEILVINQGGVTRLIFTKHIISIEDATGGTIITCVDDYVIAGVAMTASEIYNSIMPKRQ